MITSNSSTEEILEYLLDKEGLRRISYILSGIARDRVDRTESKNTSLASCWDTASRAFLRIAESAYARMVS